ncbi:MAG TPA: hypothetical protein VIF09_27085 [Polyangiaceae bacterium]
MRTLPSIALVLTIAACGGQKVDLGGGDGGSVGDSAGGEGGGASSGSSSGGSSSGGSSPLSGTYKGYIESFTFPDGSDVVVMTLAFAADGTVTGTIFFGNGPPLAPPTDPSVGYPPGFGGQGTPGSVDDVLEGFTFTALAGTYASPRLTIGLSTAELWKQWCALQTTIYPQYNGASGGGCGPLLGYGCLPNVATQFGGSGCAWSSCDHPAATPIDCGKLALCASPGGGACTCTMTACSIRASGPSDVTFDMQLSSGVLDGSESGIGGSVLNVHLTKEP